MRKFSYEYVNEFFYEHGYTLIDDEYVSINEALSFFDSDGYMYYLSFAKFKYSVENNENYVPCKFHVTNIHTMKNIEKWIYENECSFEIVGGEYLGNNIPSLLIHCLYPECDEKWDGRFDTIQQGNGCPFCSGHRVGRYNNIAYLRPDLVNEWDYDKNKTIPENHTIGDEDYIWWICSTCGHNWEAILNNRARGRKASGCPICNLNLSIGNGVIKETLDEFGVVYIDEKIFPDCKYKNPLRFDFYLPNRNMCMEYQGEHHFMPVRYGNRSIENSEKEYKNWLIKDEIKREYCKKRGIELLIIPYWEFDNIKEIVLNSLI